MKRVVSSSTKGASEASWVAIVVIASSWARHRPVCENVAMAIVAASSSERVGGIVGVTSDDD